MITRLFLKKKLTQSSFYGEKLNRKVKTHFLTSGREQQTTINLQNIRFSINQGTINKIVESMLQLRIVIKIEGGFFDEKELIIGQKYF